jgi:hypothetical protein
VKRALVLVALTACAQAGGQQSGDDDPGIDAPSGDAPIVIDAPEIDAGPIPVTLSQSTSETSDLSVSFACRSNADGSTRENSWYRVFRLADEGVANGLRVDSVSFAVAVSSGLVPVQVKIGTYSGSLNPPPAQLDTALITPITSSAPFTVPNTNGTPSMVTVPVSANVPALSQMIVEVFAPDLGTTARFFFLGANSAGQAAPGYLRAPACDAPQPQLPGSFDTAFTNSHFVITVAGTH